MQNIGPIMLDIDSTELCDEDCRVLESKLCGGLILFSRNFESAEQIQTLTNSIREINSSIIIAVDQEGGRVQRFTDGFSRLPELGVLGDEYAHDADNALYLASCLGELMALEVQSVGCDISFAPVLDLGYLTSKVIGRRAFSCDSNAVVQLGRAYISGMKKGGMMATGKHFPGHGSVEADSHIDIPIDERSFDVIVREDLVPFQELSSDLGAVMPAHIIFSQIDPSPAGFSSYWLKEVLRKQMGFNGVIFSDDLSMKGAEVVGGFSERAKKALEAGCDMVLVCNDRKATLEVIDCLSDFSTDVESQTRLSNLKAVKTAAGLKQLQQTERWQLLSSVLSQVN
ncbi:beta-N-acetylhexosaminidase [Aliikangiella sp. IMCC44359]|uniref:beta-N-acetylhexosaminidase n=1 Tax=Aliikangiella sp. IMCC44359 TaxID=3459125 RepID=UPI00403ACD24